MTKLREKTIWITGASSGIGEELTYQLVEKGNTIIISSRRAEELERVKRSCSNQSEDRIFVVPLDLDQLETIDAVTVKVLEKHDVDVLINNAGVSQRSLAAETDFEVDERILRINYLSAVKLTKLVLPGMMQRKQGHIAVTSSLVGKFGTPYRSSYAASKHALHGFFDALRAEVWSHNIKVTLFCAGYIKTNLSINALGKDGSIYNRMDRNQAKGKSAKNAAKAMINAIERDHMEVNFGGKEVLGTYLKRFAPGLLFRAIRKMKINHVEEAS